MPVITVEAGIHSSDVTRGEVTAVTGIVSLSPCVVITDGEKEVADLLVSNDAPVTQVQQSQMHEGTSANPASKTQILPKGIRRKKINKGATNVVSAIPLPTSTKVNEPEKQSVGEHAKNLMDRRMVLLPKVSGGHDGQVDVLSDDGNLLIDVDAIAYDEVIGNDDFDVEPLTKEEQAKEAKEASLEKTAQEKRVSHGGQEAGTSEVNKNISQQKQNMSEELKNHGSRKVDAKEKRKDKKKREKTATGHKDEAVTQKSKHVEKTRSDEVNDSVQRSGKNEEKSKENSEKKTEEKKQKRSESVEPDEKRDDKSTSSERSRQLDRGYRIPKNRGETCRGGCRCAQAQQGGEDYRRQDYRDSRPPFIGFGRQNWRSRSSSYRGRAGREYHGAHRSHREDEYRSRSRESSSRSEMHWHPHEESCGAQQKRRSGDRSD